MSVTLLATEWLPLTPVQQDFWEEFTLHPHQPFSIVAHFTRLQGEVNVTALRDAINCTLDETTAFTVRFAEASPQHQPALQLCPQAKPRLQFIDLKSHQQPVQSAMTLMQKDVAEPRDLRHPTHSACWLIAIGSDDYIWYLRTHHILIDGFGMALIEHRCATLYRHLLTQRDAGQPLGCYRAFQQAEQAYLISGRLIKDRSFWLHYLAAAFPLPCVWKGGDNYGKRAFTTHHCFPDALSSALWHRSQTLALSWPDVLLSLSAAWLYFTLPHVTIGEPFVMWMPALNRRTPAATDVPALAVNTVPFVVTLSAETTLDNFLNEMAHQLRKLRRHASYRLRQLGSDVGLNDQQRLFISPYINIQPFEDPTFHGCCSSRCVLAGGCGDGINLTLRSRSDASALQLDMEIYQQQCAPIQNAETLVARFHHFLHHALQPLVGEQAVIDLLA